MDNELKSRLESIEHKLDQMQKMVTKIRRVQRRTNTARLLYWLFLALLALGAFYFIQPAINQLKSIYNFGGTDDTQNLNTLLQQLNGYQDN